MKRLLCIILSLCLLLCACSGTPAGTSEPTVPAGTTGPSETAPSAEATVPGVDNDMSYQDQDLPIADEPAETTEPAPVETTAPAFGEYTVRIEDPEKPIHCGAAFVFDAVALIGEAGVYTIVEEATGFTPAERLTDVKFGLLDWFETESWQMSEVLYTMDELDPDHCFLAQVVFWGDMTTYGISFTDENGEVRHYAISISGKDGSLVCTEYVQ